MEKSKITETLKKLNDTDTIEKKLTKICTVILVVGLFLIVCIGIVMGNALSPVDTNDTTKIEFKVENGWGTSKVIDELGEKKLIKNAFLAKLYLKIKPIDGQINEGTYMISKAMSVEDILKMLSSSSSIENETINITLAEGKRFTSYMQQIADTFNFNYDDIMKKTSDTEYLNKLIEKYWFITDDILNKNLYYPLEGYIFADTYNIRKNASIEEVLSVLLSEMGNKLSPYKDDIASSGKSIHSLLTLASMVELEAGTGDFSDNTVKASEREVVASVFTNRLNDGMRLGSDVTTYYDAKRSMGESIDDVLTICNGYNTRDEAACVSGLPIGPICTPSLSSIKAAINPAKTNYLYFVADKNGKLYAAVDYAGHLKNINYLRSHDLWY